jgi:diguanylate cyclase (GGDEF)-like protein
VFFVTDPDPGIEPLISEYEAAIRALRLGEFRIHLTGHPEPAAAGLQAELLMLAAELERKFDEAGKIQRIAEHVSSGVFLDDVLDRVFESFRSIIPYSRIGCALLSDDGRTLTAIWGRSDSADVKIGNGYTAPMEGSSLQQVLETGVPRILNDLESYLTEHPGSMSTKLIVAEGMRSSLTCPLVAQGRALGFLFFSSTEKNTYQGVHEGIYRQIAGQLSTLIEKGKIYKKLYELNEKLLLTQRELERKASHDSLTGLYNRGAIIELLEAQLSRAKRGNRPFSVMMVDVDDFRQFNDKHGHLAGDVVLKEVATILSEQLRKYDYVGRYGGEEFLILLSDADQKVATETAQRLRQVVSITTASFGEMQLGVTISIGVSIPTRYQDLDVDRFIASADEALYAAKRNGRNRVEVMTIR